MDSCRFELCVITTFRDFNPPSIGVGIHFSNFFALTRVRENRRSASTFAFHLSSFNTDFRLSRGSFSRFFVSRSEFLKPFRTILSSMESSSKANLIFRCVSAALVIQLKPVQEQYSKFVHFWKNS